MSALDASGPVAPGGAAPRGAGDLAGPERADLLRCVHCGLCLSSCPTYRETKLETASPRGRIYLMRQLAEGRLEPTRELANHLDLCLNCRACETACPAGVHYGLLLETTRARLALELPPTPGERVRDFMLEHVFPFPDRMRLVAGLVKLAHRLGLARLARGPLGKLLPAFARAGAELAPETGDDAARDARPVEPGVYAPYEGAPRARVGWFRTCTMPEFFPAADRAAVQLLREAGAEVVVPERQGCCGSLHAHAGRRETARRLARHNLGVFEEAGPLDWIATDAAGCGATLREYGDLVPGGRAAAFAARVRDVSEVLAELGLPPARAAVSERIGVHDPCHLAHAQRVREAPRALLRALPGAVVVDLPGSDRCCGSAGIYNLTRPAMAQSLLEQKMQAVESVQPTVVAVANPGCLLQMQWGARQRGLGARMVHPVELVARAYPRGDAERHA
jgi:glycolate oxidase iron-sulfur subunit